MSLLISNVGHRNWFITCYVIIAVMNINSSLQRWEVNIIHLAKAFFKEHELISIVIVATTMVQSHNKFGVAV